MANISHTVAPKSDQLNADDFISGRSMTVLITAVKVINAKDQPVHISYEGDNGKPWKPSLGMRRILMKAWTEEGDNYIGKYVTLYNDESVKFGASTTGGIRISHMSHIDRDFTWPLTVSKGKRQDHTVKLLRTPTAEIKSAGDKAAASGIAAYTAWKDSLTPDVKETIKVVHSTWAAQATRADAQKACK